MNVKCPICGGTGKVDKDFGMGKCKEIPGDYYHRECPGCDGTGMQFKKDEESRPIIHYPPYNPWNEDPWKKRRKKTFPEPFDIPPPAPFPDFPQPFNPFRKPKKYRRTPLYCSIL
jgi:hypothetical protein